MFISYLCLIPGCFSLIPITKGTEFGPYEGRIVYDKEDETVNPKFSWEVSKNVSAMELGNFYILCPSDLLKCSAYNRITLL